MQYNMSRISDYLCVVIVMSVGSMAAAAPVVIPVGPGHAVKTPQGARDAAREWRAAHGGRLPSDGLELVFDDGTYVLSQTLELDARDDGVVWKARNRGKAVFSGGLALTEWRPDGASGILRTEVPAGVEIPDFGGGGEERYAQRVNYPLWLYQGDERLDCARWPNSTNDVTRIDETFVKTEACLGGWINNNTLGNRSVSGVVRFDTPRLEAWAREPDLWAYGLWQCEYCDQRLAVTNIDLGARALALDIRWYSRGFRINRQFYVFNAISEIDVPGEWALDRNTRTLRLLPKADVTKTPPQLAVIEYGLHAQGVTGLVVDGLAFSCVRRDGVRLDSCTGAVVRACAVRQTGAWGVTVKGGRNALVTGCDLTDLGEGGVRLKGGDSETLERGNHRVTNCHVWKYGRVCPVYRAGVALWGCGNTADHNLIHHGFHQGAFFDGNDHLLAWNVIHDVNLYNNDAGAIYCCQLRDWSRRGTVVEHNFIHESGKQPHPTSTHGIYIDDASSGVTVRGNIISRTCNAIMIGNGNEVCVSSNLTVGCNCGYWRPDDRKTRNSPTMVAHDSPFLKALRAQRAKYESAPWRAHYPELAKILSISDRDVVAAHDQLDGQVVANVSVACSRGRTVPHEAEQIAKGICTVGGNVELADAGFVDYAKLDLRLRPDSPVRAVLGDPQFEKMGLYPDPDRLTPPVKFGPDVTWPKSARPEPSADAAQARIDVYVEKLLDGKEAMAEDMYSCELLPSQKGRRVYASVGTAPGWWKSFRFSFVPTVSAQATFALSGGWGMRTEYRNIRAAGATLAPFKEYTADCGMQSSQQIELKKGERVTVTFEARCSDQKVVRQ